MLDAQHRPAADLEIRGRDTPIDIDIHAGMHQRAVGVEQPRPEQLGLFRRQLLDRVVVLRRPIPVHREHVGVDDQQAAAACMLCGDVVGRTEPGVARQHENRDIQPVGAARNLRRLAQHLDQLGAVADIDVLVIAGSRAGREERVLDELKFRLAVKAHDDRAFEVTGRGFETLEAGAADDRSRDRPRMADQRVAEIAVEPEERFDLVVAHELDARQVAEHQLAQLDIADQARRHRKFGRRSVSCAQLDRAWLRAAPIRLGIAEQQSAEAEPAGRT